MAAKPPTAQNPADRPVFHDKMFVVLIAAVTLAFAIVVAPLVVALFWAVVLAILFTPVYRWVAARLGNHPSIASLVTVALVLAMVIVPLVVVGAMLVQEAGAIGSQLKSGELAPGRIIERVFGVLPAWATDILKWLGFGDPASLQKQFSAGVMSAANAIGARAVDLGQNAVAFVVGAFIMIYVLFFLLRDGSELYARIRNAVPLRQDIQQRMFPRFAGAVRATVKGSLTVAVVQGIVGGIVFWALGFEAPVLWGTVMGFFALVPAIGTALVWAPAGLYLVATGDVTKGVILLGLGAGVISMIDNFLGPILVGKDTRMPDWVVLVSVLGGIAVFGFTGIVAGPAIAALFLAAWGIVAGTEGRA